VYDGGHARWQSQRRATGGGTGRRHRAREPPVMLGCGPRWPDAAAFSPGGICVRPFASWAVGYSRKTWKLHFLFHGTKEAKTAFDLVYVDAKFFQPAVLVVIEASINQQKYNPRRRGCNRCAPVCGNYPSL